MSMYFFRQRLPGGARCESRRCESDAEAMAVAAALSWDYPEDIVVSSDESEDIDESDDSFRGPMASRRNFTRRERLVGRVWPSCR